MDKNDNQIPQYSGKKADTSAFGGGQSEITQYEGKTYPDTESGLGDPVRWNNYEGKKYPKSI